MIAWVWAALSTLTFSAALDGADTNRARALGISVVLGLLLVRLLIARLRRETGGTAWLYIAFMSAMPVLWLEMEEGMRVWRR